MTELVKVEDLSITYGRADRPAVDGVTFSLAPGESLALVGETGSGKTSVVMALAQLLGPGASIDARTMSFEGHDMLRMRGKALRALRRERIGMVFQDPFGSWNPSRKIGTQLLEGSRGAERQRLRSRLVEILGRIGISRPESRLEDYPHQYSGGMLQRTLIAGALLRGPSLVIGDEPTSALDTTVQADILALIAQLQQDRELALVVVSHDLGVVARIAERTIVMYHGRMVEDAPTAELLTSPRHPYTINLIAAVPLLHGPRQRRLGVKVAQGLPSLAGCVYAHRCALATELCRTTQPELRQVGQAQVACHFADQSKELLEAAE